MKLFNSLGISCALTGQVAGLVLTASPVSPVQLPATATSHTLTLSHETQRTSAAPRPSISAAQSQMVPSAPITIAPLTANPVMRRQRCFNDQGFSVDCATWTGYYYTWGPPGNPYEGGPGGGQGGSGSGGGGSGVVYQAGSTFSSPNIVMMLSAVLLLLLSA